MRVPVANVPSENAVSANHVEYKHPKTGEWTKMRLPAGGGGGVSGHMADPSTVKSLIPNFESKQAR